MKAPPIYLDGPEGVSITTKSPPGEGLRLGRSRPLHLLASKRIGAAVLSLVALALLCGIALLHTPDFARSSEDSSLLTINPVNFDIDASMVNISSISDICQATVWVPNRWMYCEGISGGLNNMRTIVLSCLRYTMAAGAGFIMPRLFIRSVADANFAHLWDGGTVDLDYFFDTAYLQHLLSVSCPQMPVLKSIGDLHGSDVSESSIAFTPRDLHFLARGEKAPEHYDWTGNHHTSEFRVDLETYIGSQDYKEADTHLVMRTTNIFLEWPAMSDGYPFYTAFGSLARYAPWSYRIASEAHHNLMQMSGRKGYYGIHLRVEGDASLVPEFLRFDAIVAGFLDDIEHFPELDTVLVACGDEAAVGHFTRVIHEQYGKSYLQIATKADLLSPASRNDLGSFNFDQQAMVDYLLMLKSTRFGGIPQSSFSQAVFQKRHVVTRAADAPNLLDEDKMSIYYAPLQHRAAENMARTMWP